MGAKIRINITVDPETIRVADRLARARKMSRSALIRETLREADANHKRKAEEAARQRQRRQAAEAINRLAHDFGDWPAEAILRAARDRWARGLKR